MTTDEILRQKAEIEARCGPWTAHNIRLGDGIYTISEEPAGDEVKLRRITQVVLDIFGDSLEGVRVLDLACLEGMYALELARRGAAVVAIEGREANVEKARFAARALALHVDFQLGDVRDLSELRHGQFDLVLALGILYHLDAPDLFELTTKIGALSRRAAILDTSVGTAGTAGFRLGNVEYRGIRLVEHAPESTQEERIQAVWSSLDNLTAVALTRPSLERLLARTGFTSVFECHVPAEPRKEVNRVTLLALKGASDIDLISPAPPFHPADVPERPSVGRRLEASSFMQLGRFLPRPLRTTLRRIIGTETRRH